MSLPSCDCTTRTYSLDDSPLDAHVEILEKESNDEGDYDYHVRCLSCGREASVRGYEWLMAHYQYSWGSFHEPAHEQKS